MARVGFQKSIACMALSACAVVGALTTTTQAQMTTGSSMPNFNKALNLPQNSRGSQLRVELIEASQPACIYYPGETPKMTFQFINSSNKPMNLKAKIDLRAYGTRGISGDIWKPDVFLIKDLPDLPITVTVPANSFKNVTMDVPLPEEFGGYAGILDVNGTNRQMLFSAVRAMKPNVPNVPFPKQSLEAVDPAVLDRLGVHAVRWGIGFVSKSQGNYANYMQDLDRKMKEAKAHNLTVVVEVGAGEAKYPTGFIRPQLDDRGNARQGGNDYSWDPSEDANYRDFVKTIVSKYGWPNGPVTAIKLWNEPWEGASISGWGADMIRYRELFKMMGETVHETNKAAGTTVLTGGCDSSTNTWDKLFGDGSDEFLPYLDFCSIHYQGIASPALWRKWVDRKVGNGRVLIWDTESWVANSEDRIAGLVTTNRAAGYDRSMGMFIGNVVTFDNFGNPRRAQIYGRNGQMREQELAAWAWPPASALCAVQAMVGEREFKQTLFPNGLPWVYVFEGQDGNADDGSVVILGDLGEVFANTEVMLFHGVRSLSEVMQKRKDFAAGKPIPTLNTPVAYSGASITIQATDDFSLRDFYGNPVVATDGQYKIPLDSRGFFLRADPTKPGSFKKLTDAIAAGKIEGIEALDMQAHDMVVPVTASDSAIRFTLTNVLNRPVNGTLNVQLVGKKLAPVPVKLDANQTADFTVPVSGITPTGDNRYAMYATFTADDGSTADVYDTMHVNLISHRTITVDGSLDDWKDVLPQVVESDGTVRQSLTEAAWLPFKNFDAGQNGGIATGYLAYDDQNFYFAAKIADNTTDRGTLRFADRDNDADFYPEKAIDAREEGKPPKTLIWPKGVRRFSYRRDPVLPSGNFPNFDNVQIAFNAIPDDQKADWIPNLPGRPEKFISFKDTDYEYALNTVAQQYGGGFEVFRLLVPGMVRKNFYPRQPASPLDGAVTSAKLITKYDATTRYTEVAIPWSELPDVKALVDAGKPVKFSFRINHNSGGSNLELGSGRSASRQNQFTFHVDWRPGWANEIEFNWEK